VGNNLKKVKIAVYVMAVVLIAGSFLVNKIVSVKNTTGGSISDSIVSTVRSLINIKGDVTGEVGKAYLTQWFNFSVLSVERVKEYSGYVSEDGNILIDVEIAELCTFDESIDMGISDFFMDSDSFLEYVYPITPLDDTMMPEHFMLQPKEKATYHMVYEVPEDTDDLRLVYIELDEKNNEGATFTIKIS
jgi:hypothetical protein